MRKEKDSLTKFLRPSVEVETSRISCESTVNMDVSNDDVNIVLVTENEVPSMSEANDYSDIGKWPENTQSITDLLVQNGPVRIIDYEFPVSIDKAGSSRKFSAEHYFRKLSNGEKYNRDLLVYSKSKNALFCFCCKLFSKKNFALNHQGFTEWKNTNGRLNLHETSSDHFSCFETWNDMIKRLNRGLTINSMHQKEMNENKLHWKSVLERLFSLIKLHGSQNIALRGNSDKLFEDDNGNFLKIVEFLAKFDPVMKEHLRRIKNKEIYQHYIRKNIQNEIFNEFNKLLNNK